MKVEAVQRESLGMLALASGVAFGGYLVEKGGSSLSDFAKKTETAALRTMGDWMVFGGQGLTLTGKYAAYYASAELLHSYLVPPLKRIALAMFAWIEKIIKTESWK